MPEASQHDGVSLAILGSSEERYSVPPWRPYEAAIVDLLRDSGHTGASFISASAARLFGP
jgi:hypothetical protein